MGERWVNMYVSMPLSEDFRNIFIMYFFILNLKKIEKVFLFGKLFPKK